MVELVATDLLLQNTLVGHQYGFPSYTVCNVEIQEAQHNAHGKELRSKCR
jgi:hypothetical protein